MKILKFSAAAILIIATAMLLPYVFAAIGITIAALFTPSPIMNELRKKAGSDVFSKNHSGPFIRKRVKGTNPKSAKQIAVRAAFGADSKAWKSLGSSNILAWIAYAKNFIFKNRLGQSITLTGETWYIKLSRILQTMGIAPVSTPPSISYAIPVLPPGLAIAGVASTSYTLTMTGALPSTTNLRVYASAPISSGRTYNSNYRYIGMIVTADGASVAITGKYTAVFGAVGGTGTKTYFKCIASDNTNGLSNVAQIFTVTF